ncbi:hypothetical protein P152DRAFT_474335 [Eremomyces bilateralis CBS 781.70]|uniref:DUF3835 domain-containing protein n=1 Tax=Eremomyces bilateralis CBS 781.70 TaxID=1392243 RepID=A0A6G1G2F9_9PEZI|nr:uncharacterized protein P152DRAFT_474335 [Eremomyces bilateralis CBS 781.70]KAF1812110.1 hypothetical protein P152DRAFT_474335 [Eremomyces bilateralis CBS 781.70]
MENNVDAASSRLLDDLHFQKQRLDDLLSKLRTSLKYWQTCELEYEKLKEEILHSGEEVSSEKIIESWMLYDKRVIQASEVKEIFRHDKGLDRSSAQVADVVSRRVDYVQQNIRSIQKQIHVGEKALEKVDNALNPLFNEAEPNVLPLAEIREELDEDGNVISSHVSQPATEADGIQAMLEKAGISLPEKSTSDDFAAARKESSKAQVQPAPDITSPSDVRASSTTKIAQQNPSNSDGHEDHRPPSDSTSQPALPKAEQPSSMPMSSDMRTIELGTAADSGPGLVKGSFYSGTDVIELNENEEIIGRTPLVPENEAPEDASLRREMLEYGLNGMGPVVAEMDIEEDSDMEFDEVDEEFEDDTGSEENGYGMSTNFQITDEYRQQMMELQRRLNASFSDDLGDGREDIPRTFPTRPKSATATLPAPDNSPIPNGKAKVATPTSALKSDKTTPKKGVRFATDLDVAEESVSHISKPDTARPEPQPREKGPAPSPLADVVESAKRPSAPSPPDTLAKSTKRVSRFKAARTHGPTF